LVRAAAIIGLVLGMTACSPRGADAPSAIAPVSGPAPVDYKVWRDVGSSKPGVTLALQCAQNLEGLEAADHTLKDKVTLHLPWDIQISRSGRLQGQCRWDVGDTRSGRLVFDVLCSNKNVEACSKFSYATEGEKRIERVNVLVKTQPAYLSTYPPGKTDAERLESVRMLRWVQDHGPDEVGTLRATVSDIRVGFVDGADRPFVCGALRAGSSVKRFAVYGLGPLSSRSYKWAFGPSAHDFCDSKQGDLQSYSVSNDHLNATLP
jgi:hypothetical protein